jgi:hypothetical protein
MSSSLTPNLHGVSTTSRILQPTVGSIDDGEVRKSSRRASRSPVRSVIRAVPGPRYSFPHFEGSSRQAGQGLSTKSPP